MKGSKQTNIIFLVLRRWREARAEEACGGRGARAGGQDEAQGRAERLRPKDTSSTLRSHVHDLSR